MLFVLLMTSLPTVLYVWLLWWLDRYEKEPVPLMLAVFFWGAVPAVSLALLIEKDLAPDVLGYASSSLWVAPLVEEPLKMLALVGVFVFFRYEYDGVLDGIIYGALVGFGFAMTENALYFYRESSDLTSLIWLRSVLFGLNHAFFTSILGVMLGVVRYGRSRWIQLTALPAALLLAIFFHWLHNYASQMPFPGVLMAWFVDSGGVFVVILVALVAWNHERTWIENELLEEVEQSFIDLHTYAIVHSNRLRIRTQWRALVQRGWVCFRQVRELHHLLTELAFLKYQMRIGDIHCRPSDLMPLRLRICELVQLLEPIGLSRLA